MYLEAPQSTFVIKNVASLTQGTEWPFRYLDATILMLYIFRHKRSPKFPTTWWYQEHSSKWKLSGPEEGPQWSKRKGEVENSFVLWRKLNPFQSQEWYLRCNNHRPTRSRGLENQIKDRRKRGECVALLHQRRTSFLCNRPSHQRSPASDKSRVWEEQSRKHAAHDKLETGNDSCEPKDLGCDAQQRPRKNWRDWLSAESHPSTLCSK